MIIFIFFSITIIINILRVQYCFILSAIRIFSTTCFDFFFFFCFQRITSHVSDNYFFDRQEPTRFDGRILLIFQIVRRIIFEYITCVIRRRSFSDDIPYRTYFVICFLAAFPSIIRRNMVYDTRRNK